jgi:uncharacterized protein
MMKVLLIAALLTFSAAGGAQTNPTKKELIEKLLKLQQPSVENIARALVEAPALQMGQKANIALQRRIAADQQATVSKEMQSDMNRYFSETYPTVRDRAIALAPSTVGKLLEEKFSESELKELIAILESPISRKYAEVGVRMQRELQEKLVAQAKPLMEPKLKNLEKEWAKRLGLDAAASASSPAAPSK